MKQKQNLLKKKGDSGITLVALVVTIVVLLILAGITITIIFNDSGIINKARETANAVDKSHTDTEKELANLTEELGATLGEVNKQGKLVPEYVKSAKWTDETGSAPIPGGYCVAKDSSTGEQNTVKSGLVISDLAEDTLDNEPNEDGKRGNQFVWVPVSSEQLKEMYGVDNEGKQHGKLYEFTSSGKENLNWSEKNGVMTIENTDRMDYSYREPDIAIEYDGSDAEYKPEYFKEDISDTMTGEQFKEQLQSEFDNMIDSVKNYGGFYIGRYETGFLKNIYDIVVQKGATVTDYGWYLHYQKIKNIANKNKNVTSSMIWGCQWDRTLEWIAQSYPKVDGTPNYDLLTDSSSWGNYNGKGDPQQSGSNPDWQKNHIYDLAGNTWEWIMEAADERHRAFRGGNYNSGTECQAYSRDWDLPYDGGMAASRSILYINL